MFKPGESGNPNGRPLNSESIRTHLRHLGVMSYQELQNYRPKTTFEAIARRRLLSAASEEGEVDYRNADALTDQLDGKPNQPQTLDATVETKVNPIVELLKLNAESKPKTE